MKLKTDSGSLEMGGKESSWLEISRRPNKCRHHSSLTCTAVISYRFQTNYSIAVLPMSKIKIVCPNPAMIPIPVEGSTPKEELYENLWMVDKQAYDACVVDPARYANKLLMKCNTPLQLRYFTIVFQRFSAVGPDGLEFEPGKDYYIIGN